MGENANARWEWHNTVVGEGYQARGVVRQRTAASSFTPVSIVDMRGPPSSGPAAADAGSGVEEHQGSRKSEGTIDKGHDKKSAKDDKKSPKHKKEHKQKSEKKERKDRSHKKKRKRKDRKRRSRSDSSASTTGSDSNSDNNKTEGYKRPRVPEFNPLLQTLALSLSDTTRAFVVN